MCEIMTLLAALAFTALYFHGRRGKAVFTTMLMFWGAALMWLVDCVGNALDGEAFFDISREDAVLGVIILAAGLAVFGALTLREALAARRRAVC